MRTEENSMAHKRPQGKSTHAEQNKQLKYLSKITTTTDWIYAVGSRRVHLRYQTACAKICKTQLTWLHGFGGFVEKSENFA